MSQPNHTIVATLSQLQCMMLYNRFKAVFQYRLFRGDHIIMTNHPLKLGYKASAEQFGPRPLLNFAIEAEECGFDSVWVSDHFQPWRHTDGHAPFAFAWLAAVGERTERVLLGTSGP